MSLLSPEIRCYSFDHRGNAYARGEGIGVVILKRLSDAIADNDTIRAVIHASNTNQNGRTPGITPPSSQLQAKLIRDIYRKAGLSMKYARFVEAHGTGTAVGDPIEAKAIGTTFRPHRTINDPLYVGAVKTNLGHLKGASGSAGLIKTVLILEKALIPPNAKFERINPSIDLEYLRLKLPSACTPWHREGLRKVSVNSFGFGGANSRLIVDDACNYLKLRNLSANHSPVQSEIDQTFETSDSTNHLITRLNPSTAPNAGSDQDDLLLIPKPWCGQWRVNPLYWS